MAMTDDATAPAREPSAVTNLKVGRGSLSTQLDSVRQKMRDQIRALDAIKRELEAIIEQSL